MHAPRGRAGFTLLEVLIVLMIGGVLLGVVARNFTNYNRERAAQQAAYLLSRDLRLARAAAVRSRAPVSLVVNAADRRYVVRDTAGVQVVSRVFSAGDLEVQSISLGLSGDSVTFNDQGVADLSGVSGGVAEARVASPSTAWLVRFNATGSSTIEEE